MSPSAFCKVRPRTVVQDENKEMEKGSLLCTRKHNINITFKKIIQRDSASLFTKRNKLWSCPDSPFTIAADRRKLKALSSSWYWSGRNNGQSGEGEKVHKLLSRAQRLCPFTGCIFKIPSFMPRVLPATTTCPGWRYLQWQREKGCLVCEIKTSLVGDCCNLTHPNSRCLKLFLKGRPPFLGGRWPMKCALFLASLGDLDAVRP